MVTSEAAGRKRRGRRPSQDGIMGYMRDVLNLTSLTIISIFHNYYEKFKCIKPCVEYLKEFFN